MIGHGFPRVGSFPEEGFASAWDGSHMFVHDSRIHSHVIMFLRSHILTKRSAVVHPKRLFVCLRVRVHLHRQTHSVRSPSLALLALLEPAGNGVAYWKWEVAGVNPEEDSGRLSIALLAILDGS